MEQKFSYTREINNLGISYIGNVAQSAKLEKSYDNGVMTYCIYLAPATMAGRTNKGTRINVCPRSEHCKQFCLNGSGHNKGDQIMNGTGRSRIDQSRIKKTRLFYNDRDLFMRLVICEIKKWQKKAQEKGMGFSIRLNGTSDLSPELFSDPETRLNLLQLFRKVQFYDYTKVYKRIALMHKYANYDLTFSHSGYNWDECQKFLDEGGKVAVVFLDEKLPKSFHGYPICDGNLYDMRYLDPAKHIVGLHYHRVANDYYVDTDGIRKFKAPDTPFVIKVNDPNVDYVF